MKSIILSMGEVLLNMFVFVGILIGIFSVFAAGVQGLFIGIGIVIFVILTTFLLYLLIDIRDKISENNVLLKEASKNKMDDN